MIGRMVVITLVSLVCLWTSGPLVAAEQVRRRTGGWLEVKSAPLLNGTASCLQIKSNRKCT